MCRLMGSLWERSGLMNSAMSQGTILSKQPLKEDIRRV
jgi:hypothetical protein